MTCERGLLKYIKNGNQRLKLAYLISALSWIPLTLQYHPVGKQHNCKSSQNYDLIYEMGLIGIKHLTGD